MRRKSDARFYGSDVSKSNGLGHLPRLCLQRIRLSLLATGFR